MKAKSKVILGIKSLIKKGVDINEEVNYSNILYNEHNDYNLIVRYIRPIEVKYFSMNKTDLEIHQFLITTGKILRLDFVDLIFAKLTSFTLEEFKTKINNEVYITLNIEDINKAIINILSIDELPVCKSFLIETDTQYIFISENWIV